MGPWIFGTVPADRSHNVLPVRIRTGFGSRSPGTGILGGGHRTAWGELFEGLRREGRKPRMVVFLHETHCRPSQLGIKGPLLAPWQRYTVGAVARLGEVVFATVARYRQQAIVEYGIAPERVVVMPVGANVPVAPATPERRRALRKKFGWSDDEVIAVAFGSFGTQLQALQTFDKLIWRGFERGLSRIVCVGGNQGDFPESFGEWRAKYSQRGVLEILGHRSAVEAAEVLACSDVGLCATPRDYLGKSGSFKALAGAGLAVIVPPGTASGDDRAFPVFSEETWDWLTLHSHETTRRREALYQYVDQTCNWDLLARRALERMSADGPGSELSNFPGNGAH